MLWNRPLIFTLLFFIQTGIIYLPNIPWVLASSSHAFSVHQDALASSGHLEVTEVVTRDTQNQRSDFLLCLHAEQCSMLLSKNYVWNNINHNKCFYLLISLFSHPPKLKTQTHILFYVSPLLNLTLIHHLNVLHSSISLVSTRYLSNVCHHSCTHISLISRLSYYNLSYDMNTKS